MGKRLKPQRVGEKPKGLLEKGSRRSQDDQKNDQDEQAIASTEPTLTSSVQGHGRKNWLFAGSLAGAKRAAILYSLAQGCRLAGIDCWAYFHDVLVQVATLPQQRIHELTPDRWAEARAQEAAIIRS